MGKKKRILASILGAVLFLGSTFNINMKTQAAAGNLGEDKYEFRAAWMSTAYNIDWPRADNTTEAQKSSFISKIDSLKSAGFNALLFQVRPMGDAVYPSTYSPWSKYITGTQGQAPDYDPMAFALEEAHKRNMEFHSWFNPFRISGDGNFNVDEYINNLPYTSPLKLHPEWIVKYTGTKTYYWLNLGIPEVRQYVVDLIAEAVSKYDIDGVHLDDYFYPYPVYNVSGAKVEFPDAKEYLLYGAGYGSVDDWRRANVDNFVYALSNRIKTEKNNVKFGISPFGIWKNKISEGGAGTNGMQSYYNLYADSKKWVDNQWIDYIVPQIYWNFGYPAADYQILANWWADTVKDKNVHLYIGHAAYKVGDPNNGAAWTIASELPNQIKYNRNNSWIKGSAFFSTKDILNNKLGIYDEIKNNLYNTSAFTPKMSWKDNENPNPPTLVSVTTLSNGVQVIWNGSSSADVTKYVLYRFKEGETVNLDKASKIVEVIKASESSTYSYIDTTADGSQKYTYLVTALDRLNNESVRTDLDMGKPNIIAIDINKDSPQKINSVISISANTLGGINPIYRLSVNDGTGWKVICDYSSNKSWSWVPTAVGDYSIKVDGKNLGSPWEYDDSREIPFQVRGVYKVAIDAGHGGSDPGASGFTGTFEKDLNLSVSIMVRDILSSRGIDVIMTREWDVTMGLSTRTFLANYLQADILVSIHQNNFIDYTKGPSGNVIGVRYPEGIETFSFPGSSIGAQLAKRIQDNLVKNTNAVNRGTKTADFHMLRESFMPAVLVECGFISNPGEEAKLITKQYQETLAYSIAYGIMEHLDVNLEGMGINEISLLKWQ